MKRLAAVLGTIVLVSAALAATASAHAAVARPNIDWNHAFLFETTGGIVNPAVLVGFNPQPEPPEWLTQLGGAPPEPVLTLRNQNPGTFFDLFLAVDLLLPAVITLQPVPDDGIPAAPVATLHLEAIGSSLAGAPTKFFDVFLDFLSSSGGVMDGASAVMFNPQPEPPGDFGGDSDFGANFTFTSFSDVSVSLRILDVAGTQLSFILVPEPTGLALMGLGLAFLARRRSRR
jgi:hypothetical protein